MERSRQYQDLITCLDSILNSKKSFSPFVSSLVLQGHPMLEAKTAIKTDYLSALQYFVLRQKQDAFVKARLDDYRWLFRLSSDQELKQQDTLKSVNTVVNTRLQPWKNKYKYWLLCDAALILLDEQIIGKTAAEIASFTTKGQRERLNKLLSVLIGKSTDISAFPTAANLIEQYQKNRRHASIAEKRFVVTANMSAGKSTFINAIIGKPLARTSEEACTGNITFFYNKPFEDNAIHFSSNSLTLHAGSNTLSSFSWENQTKVASFFRLEDRAETRICIVDTPGVNSAINKRHGSISKNVLQQDIFDKVIYVLNASKLGTDEELAYIRWISEHVPHEKVIFILNKLDNFKNGEDDISASINGVRNDLLEFFENPIICPLSARFAFLLKMKSYGEQLTPDEQDEYEYFAKKFKKPTYDLSKYYACTYPTNDDEIFLLSQKCGMYGLEKILQGGKA